MENTSIDGSYITLESVCELIAIIPRFLPAPYLVSSCPYSSTCVHP